MSDLTDFLLARIAEDEELAREAAAPPARTEIPADTDLWPGRWGWNEGWHPDEGTDEVIAADGWASGDTHPAYVIAFTPREHDAARHITRHDPARVLAECEAKRAIVTFCSATNAPIDCGIVLSLMTLPYADHPDYREEWRP